MKKIKYKKKIQYFIINKYVYIIEDIVCRLYNLLSRNVKIIILYYEKMLNNKYYLL